MTPLHALSDPALQQRARQAVRALPDAPAALQQVAISLWAASPLAQGLPGQLANPAQGLPGRAAGLAQAGLALVRQLVAVLQFDSWAAPAVAPGMRSLRSPTRHLLFSSVGRDIDLRIVPASQGYALSGQVLGPDEAGSVELIADLADPDLADPGDAAAQHAGELDALGEFRIDGVAAGAWRLRLRIGSDLIALPTIEIGDAASAVAQPAPPDGPIA